MSDKFYTPIAALVFTAVVAAFAALAGFEGYAFRENLAQRVGTHLLALIFFALLIERAVEVIVNNRFIGREKSVNETVLQLTRKGKILQAALDMEVQQPVPVMSDPEALAAANKAKNDRIEELRSHIREAKRAKIEADENAIPERTLLSAQKARYAATTATLFGALIAVTGTTALSGFVVLPDTPSPGRLFGIADQLELFAGVDILLTALILAGGSDGIHKIIKNFVKVGEDVTLGA